MEPLDVLAELSAIVTRWDGDGRPFDAVAEVVASGRPGAFAVIAVFADDGGLREVAASGVPDAALGRVARMWREGAGAELDARLERVARHLGTTLNAACVASLVATGGRALGALLVGGPEDAGFSREESGKLAEAIGPLINFWQRVEGYKADAMTDPVTGLYNRRFLEKALWSEVARCGRNRAPLSVLFLDIDNFKQVNDVWGHAAGDELLRAVGRMLTESLRRNDVVARWGGDEFAVVLSEVGREAAEAIGVRLVEEVRRVSSEVLPGGVSVEASVGVASSEDMPEDELLQAADRRMYRAKSVRTAPAAG